MILRERTIDTQTEEISIRISFSSVDVKQKCKDIATALSLNPVAWKIPWSEQDITSYFANTWFLDYKPKYKKQLARWAAALSLRKGYFIESLTEPKKYFLTETFQKYKQQNDCLSR